MSEEIKGTEINSDKNQRHKSGSFVSIFGIAVNFFLALIKFIAGMLSGSIAIMALLIAHKKKGTGMDENDDVLGSSEITNLAGVIMSYGRDTDIEDSERLLKVTKNRLTGRCLFDGVICGYDDASKRIFAANDPGAAARSSKCFAEEDSHFTE